MSGFTAATRMLQLLAEILARSRADTVSPPRGPLIIHRLLELQVLNKAIGDALDCTPGALKLTANNTLGPQRGANGPALNYGGLGSQQAAIDAVQKIFQLGTTIRANVGRAMQANFYATLHLARSTIVRYRGELVSSIHRSSTDRPALTDELMGNGDPEAVAQELLYALHAIPIEAMAVNG